MTGSDYAQIRQDLMQIRQEMPDDRRKSPALDFGLFLLSYFASLVLVVTIMLAAGMPIHRFTVLFAIPLAWLLITLLHKKPLYALLITAAGTLFLAAVSLLVAQFFDVARESASYLKADTGLLLNGWNPFRESMAAFANTSRALPYNALWAGSPADGQPLAAVMIGAGFNVFFGNIAYGKVFNIAGMAAAVCIIAPLIRDAFRVNGVLAVLAVVFTAVNPVTLSQALTYYSDGFVFQLLTVAATALAYAAYRPQGRHAGAAKAAAFIAVCLAVNASYAALILCILLCGIFYIARVIGIARSDAASKPRWSQQLTLLSYLVLMAVAALCVLGAATYMAKLVRYGNPLHGVLTSVTHHPQLDALLSPETGALPLYQQFLYSLLAPLSGGMFSEAAIKIPFTYTSVELAESTLSATTGGWGIAFSSILAVALPVIVVSGIVLIQRGPRRLWILLATLAAVLLPVFFLPYAFSARGYLLPYWLPLAALVCLFAAGNESDGILRKLLPRIVGAGLCVLLAINCVTAYNDLSAQAQTTAQSRKTLSELIDKTNAGGQTLDVAPDEPGQYYGLIYTLRGEGMTKFNFISAIPDDQIGGTVLGHLSYRLRGDGGQAGAGAFLASLYQNGSIVIIAKQGASGTLTPEMLALLDALGLDAGTHDVLTDGYLAVIDPDGTILSEKGGAGILTARVTIGGLPVQAQSALSGAFIMIDGKDYALGRSGYNIVVFDPLNKTLVNAVVIDTDATPALSR